MDQPPTHAFSNGTEGQAWQDVWCDECKLDHSMHGPNGEGGCPIFARALNHREFGWPEEWQDWSDEDGFTMPPAIVCTKFEQCTDCDEHPERTDSEGRTHRVWAALVRSR